MKHTLALVLMVFGIVGCATTIDTSTPRAQALMQEVRSDRLALERIEQAELTANSKSTLEKEEDINELISRINETTLAIKAIQEKATQEESTQKILAVAEPTTPYECAQRYIPVEELTKCYNALPDEVKILKKVERLAQETSDKEKSDKEKRYKEMVEQQIAYREARAKEAEAKRAAKREEQKVKILAGLKLRCEEYGFTGNANISACIQREAQHDKELAMQKQELQQELRETRVALQQAQSQAQSRVYAQSLPPVVEEEEDIPFLIKFLGDVAMGVAEAYADPAFHRDVQQQKQINQLKANQRRCVHNC
ncbi:hypothetical protein N9Q82_04255 [Gammaproteobacteria bacterium]|nr:hypothetical protein [Gammaproteobacteria bacterium]